MNKLLKVLEYLLKNTLSIAIRALAFLLLAFFVLYIFFWGWSVVTVYISPAALFLLIMGLFVITFITMHTYHKYEEEELDEKIKTVWRWKR